MLNAIKLAVTKYLFWIKLAGLALAAGVIWYGIHTYNEGLREEGRSEVQAKWDKDAKDATERYNALYISTQARYRALENKRALEAQQLSVKYLNEVNKNEATYQANLAAIRAGTLRLRDQYASRTSCGIDRSKVGPSPSRIDIGAGAELSAESSEFLLSEAKRADRVVLTLNRCIAQLRADREETPQQTKD